MSGKAMLEFQKLLSEEEDVEAALQVLREAGYS